MRQLRTPLTFMFLMVASAFLMAPLGAQATSIHTEAVTFPGGSIELAVTVTLPATRGPHPTIVFLHGSGPVTRAGGEEYGKEFANAILPGRGFAQAASCLGEDYEGILDHDGWAPYDRFQRAYHQSCPSHLIRRCEDLIKVASPSAARFPLAVMHLLRKSLALRDLAVCGLTCLAALVFWFVMYAFKKPSSATNEF